MTFSTLERILAISFGAFMSIAAFGVLMDARELVNGKDKQR